MTNQINIEVEILTKKGEIKLEKFFMDKQMYEAILTLPINERRKYFANEYYDYEEQRRYNRKVISIDQNAKKIELKGQMLPFEELIATEDEKQNFNKKLHKAIKELPVRQQEFINLIYFEGLSQKDVSRKYMISEQAVSNAMQRIYSSLRKKLEKK